MGDALLQKSYTVDFLDKKRVATMGMFKSTMFKTAMSLLYLKRTLRQYRRSSQEEIAFGGSQQRVEVNTQANCLSLGKYSTVAELNLTAAYGDGTK